MVTRSLKLLFKLRQFICMKLRVVGKGDMNVFRSHRSMYLQGIDTLGKAVLDKSLLVV